MDIDSSELEKEIKNDLVRWLIESDDYTEENGWYSIGRLCDLSNSTDYQTTRKLKRGMQTGVIEVHEEGRRKYYRLKKADG